MLLVDTPNRCEIGRLCRVSDSYFSLPCPHCGYKIKPNELMRLAPRLAQIPDDVARVIQGPTAGPIARRP
jgi:hypothetical protein